MSNSELISFYDTHKRLTVRAKRDDQLLVKIQYSKKSPNMYGSRYLIRVDFPGFDADRVWEITGGYTEAEFDPKGAWVTTDRGGVGSMLSQCVRNGLISQQTATLMAAAIDDADLRISGTGTGLDAGSGWVRMIDGEPKWAYWDMLKNEICYDNQNGEEVEEAK